MKTTYFDKIKKIIQSNKGFVTRKDINEKRIPSMMLSLYVRKNKLVKHAQGFYAIDSWIPDDFLILQYQYPKLIFSFNSAIYIHFLGDIIPSKIEVTGPKNYRPFKLPNSKVVLHTDTKDKTYNLGVTKIKDMFGNNIKLYDKEKTICDLIKNRSKIDSETFIKCMRFYRDIKEKNLHNLFLYAKIMKIEDKVSSIMEIILNEN